MTDRAGQLWDVGWGLIVVLRSNIFHGSHDVLVLPTHVDARREPYYSLFYEDELPECWERSRDGRRRIA